MREEEAVALVGIAAGLVLYGLAAVRDLPTIVNRVERLPTALLNLPAACKWERSSRRRNALLDFISWTLISQFVPVALLLAFIDGAYRSSAIAGVAGAAEIVAASGWTAYLLFLMRDK